MEVYVDDDTKLTLHGLKQHYVKLQDREKNRKLFDLLDALEFNQVIIFVKTVQRCVALTQLLNEQNFPAICIHRGMDQAERWVLVCGSGYVLHRNTKLCKILQGTSSSVLWAAQPLSGWMSQYSDVLVGARWKRRPWYRLTAQQCVGVCINPSEVQNSWRTDNAGDRMAVPGRESMVVCITLYSPLLESKQLQ